MALPNLVFITKNNVEEVSIIKDVVEFEYPTSYSKLHKILDTFDFGYLSHTDHVKIHGFILCFIHHPGIVYLHTLSLHQEYFGYEKNLLDKVLSYCKTKDISYVYAYVNPSAEKVYLDYGFKIVDKVYSKGELMFTMMSKNL